MDFYMPFGKHWGKPLNQIPASYLWRLAEECDIRFRQERLYCALLEELRPRLLTPFASVGRSFSQGVDLAGVIQTWYRTMAMQCHPDRGGSNEAMKAVISGKKLLEKLLAESDAN